MRTTFIAGLVATLLLTAGTARAGEIAVVVNPDFPVDSLTLEDVQKIFLGEKEFIDGTLLRPVHYAQTSPLTEVFLERVVDLSMQGFDRYWVREVFRTGRFPPTTVDGVPAMLRMVASRRGAVGYVPADKLAGVVTVKKVLTISVP